MTHIYCLSLSHIIFLATVNKTIPKQTTNQIVSTLRHHNRCSYFTICLHNISYVSQSGGWLQNVALKTLGSHLICSGSLSQRIALEAWLRLDFRLLSNNDGDERKKNNTLFHSHMLRMRCASFCVGFHFMAAHCM